MSKKGAVTAKILIVDDEEPIRMAFFSILDGENYLVHEAVDGLDAIKKCQETKYDVIFLDIKMPRKSGIEVLEELREITPESSIIMLSGHGTIDIAVECAKKGAFDFITKPADYQRIIISIRNAIAQSALVTETKTLKRQVNTSRNKNFQDIIGHSAGIRRVKNNIDHAAAIDAASVLVLGDNGSGKELVARWVHEKSERAGRPFVAVNCAAIPTDLIESILFGHKKGAFTGAVVDQVGKFEEADGGTIFLDEIGDMSLDAQSKILRVLQERLITRLGEQKDIKINVRVIAATNKNLQEAITRRNFREDLYHRLAVAVIRVPALNDRRDDIPILANYYMSALSEDYGKTQKEFTPEALDMLSQMNWTGNIRQLRNAIERLIIFCPNENKINVDDIKEHVYVAEEQNLSPFAQYCAEFDTLSDFLRFAEREYLNFRMPVNQK